MSGRKATTKKNKQWARPFFAVLLVSIFPAVLLWAAMASDEQVTEGLWPVLVSAMIGTVIFASVWFSSGKKPVHAGFLGSIIAFVLLKFSFFKNVAGVVADGTAAAVLALVLASAAIVLVTVLLKLFGKTELMDILLSVLLVTAGVLVLFNGITIGTKLAGMLELKAQYRESRGSAEDSGIESRLPNIYYIVADEMANSYLMDKYFGLPEEANPLESYLEEKGFSVSGTSSAYTNHSIWSNSNAMNLDYICTVDTTDDDARLMAKDGFFLNELESLGYRTAQVSSADGVFGYLVSMKEPNLGTMMVGAITTNGESVFDLFTGNTILSVISDFAGDRVTYLDRMGAWFFRQRLEAVTEYYDDPASYTHTDSLALVTYLLAPHSPFICDSEGNPNTFANRCNWVDCSFYREYWLYIASYTEHIIDQILANDPDCIIILQSDHGTRGGTTPGIQLRRFEREDECAITNAVYCFSGSPDIEGLSSVNTLRTALNLAGDNLEMIEDPEYTYFQDSPYSNYPDDSEYPEIFYTNN